MRADGLLLEDAKRKANRRASFVPTSRVRLYTLIVKASASYVQRHAELRVRAHVCLQALILAAATAISGPAFAEPDPPPVSGVSPAPTAGPAVPASDTSPAALVAARELFREATADADAGRHAIALGKFQRVARIRESAAVRFNVGQCEERLGRIASALASYELAVRRAQQEPRGEEIVRMARAASEPLRARSPRLTITTGATLPKDLTVLLDGAPVPSASFGVALPVDPGEHVVAADASGHAPRAWTVTLTERHAETIDVILGDGVDAGPGPASSGARAAEADYAAPQGSTGWWTPRRDLGLASLTVGVAAAVVSAVFVVRHNDAVSDLRVACEDGCPEARHGELATTRDAAVRDQTLAIAAGVGSGALLITGGLLLAWPTPRSTASQRALRFAASPSSVGLTGHF